MKKLKLTVKRRLIEFDALDLTKEAIFGAIYHECWPESDSRMRYRRQRQLTCMTQGTSQSSKTCVEIQERRSKTPTLEKTLMKTASFFGGN